MLNQCRIFLDTAQLHANLKIGIKTGQPCWLNAIVPAGAKKHKKNASFFQLTLKFFVFEFYDHCMNKIQITQNLII